MVTIDYIVGDSIAAGIAINGFGLKNRSGAYGIKSTDSKGISEVGASPKKILGFLNEIGKQKFTNKNVIISVGLSNGPKDLTNIKSQLQLLKDVNAKVYMIGVSNDPPANLSDLKGGNDKLKNLASEFGFTFFGGFTPSSDKIHPNYSDYYKNVIKPVLEKPETQIVKPEIGLSTNESLGKSGPSVSIFGLSGASPSATPSIPPEPPIKGVFVFNVEKAGILSSTALGQLTITEKELAAEDAFVFGDVGNYEQEVIDEEYSEGAFAGAEEDVAFDIAQGLQLSQGQELLTDFDMSNPANLTATDTKNGDPNEVVAAPQISTTATGKIKKLLEVAKSQIGYKETTGYPKNDGKDSKYGAYFGMNGYHWCGMFVGWCCNQAGMILSTKDFNATNGNICNAISCVCGVSVAKKKGVWVSNGDSKAQRKSSTVKPDPGDIVFFNWKYGQKADHVGIVVEDLGNGSVRTYEGNTEGGKAGGANQKGAGVYEKIRLKELIIGYCKTALYDPTNLNEHTGPSSKKSA